MILLNSQHFFFSVPTSEIESLSEHGVMLPPNMVGLTREQIEELKLKDEFEDVCVPSGGFVDSTDPVGRRNGRGKEGAEYTNGLRAATPKGRGTIGSPQL